MAFVRAVRSQRKLRMVLTGPSGSGKTYSALKIATGLGGSIAVIDTEHSSASIYSAEPHNFVFDVEDLKHHHHQKYIDAIKDAKDYDILIIDSMTHAWYSALEMANGKFEGWAKVRPLERALIEAILDFPGSVIVTIRSKTEYVVSLKENKSGRMTNAPEKVGTAPIQSGGIEYEFDIAGDMDLNHIMSITKTRCSELDNTTWLQPGAEFADVLKAWLTDGAVMPVIPETADQKKQRLGNACRELGLKPADIKHLLTRFTAERAADLSTEELDWVIGQLPVATQQTEDDPSDIPF